MSLNLKEQTLLGATMAAYVVENVVNYAGLCNIVHISSTSFTVTDWEVHKSGIIRGKVRVVFKKGLVTLVFRCCSR